MTVNELIAELQVLAAQGHGDLDTYICPETACIFILTSIHVAKDKEGQYLLLKG